MYPFLTFVTPYRAKGYGNRYPVSSGSPLTFFTSFIQFVRYSKRCRNTVWVLDATFLPIPLESELTSKNCLVIGLDLATNKAVFSKVFYSGKTNKTFSITVLIKPIKEALRQHNIRQYLILHTDRGGQFCYKEYHHFVKTQLFLIGSMTLGWRPDKNAVIEGYNKTYKS